MFKVYDDNEYGNLYWSSEDGSSGKIIVENIEKETFDLYFEGHLEQSRILGDGRSKDISGHIEGIHYSADNDRDLFSFPKMFTRKTMSY